MTNSTSSRATSASAAAGAALTDEQILCLTMAVADRRDEMRHLAQSEEPGAPERAPFEREAATADKLHDLLASATAVVVEQ
ncbi:hypothetical protein [Nocardioides alkalitolerans]|uniref:hypothetical protein n=1 Tax=Nocardioides alkalitolerans TaxID=281714 RepID=UPI00048D7275|nr:hypothetical protein [Nocardioides alkalitolerans]